jgi:hypothetical protein
VQSRLRTGKPEGEAEGLGFDQDAGSMTKTAIINLYGDESGTLCEAFDPLGGELQPEELGENPSIIHAWMPPAETRNSDSDAEKQCVRSVLGDLAKKSYDSAVFWEESELRPRWMKKMLREGTPTVRLEERAEA